MRYGVSKGSKGGNGAQCANGHWQCCCMQCTEYHIASESESKHSTSARGRTRSLSVLRICGSCRGGKGATKDCPKLGSEQRLNTVPSPHRAMRCETLEKSRTLYTGSRWAFRYGMKSCVDIYTCRIGESGLNPSLVYPWGPYWYMFCGLRTARYPHWGSRFARSWHRLYLPS